MSAPVDIVPDTEHRGLLGRLPQRARDLIQLARFDRPIGIWLLFWPGAWAIALSGNAFARWDLLLWFFLGAAAMRSAGCVYNDIIDRELDQKVARTRDRPVASGRVSLKLAWAWLIVLCLVGLVVLVQLNLIAAILALASLGAVAAYPFMKRITWWPQAWLGIVFSWAALVGWPAAVGRIEPAMLWLYAGSMACAPCHAKIVDAWRTSPMHEMTRISSAMRAPSELRSRRHQCARPPSRCLSAIRRTWISSPTLTFP